jgi:hypothetical protein
MELEHFGFILFSVETELRIVMYGVSYPVIIATRIRKEM